MIVYYGANGMSEAPFLFALAMAARYLARWLKDDSSGALVVAASALGLAYLTREEAVFAALVAALVVLAVAFQRSNGMTRTRIHAALLDTCVCALPFIACFVGWAIVSWIIVGHPFEQFASVYGNSSQLRIQDASALSHSSGYALFHALAATFALAPLIPIVVALAVAASARRRDRRVLAPLAVAGGVLLFEVAAHALGHTFPWLRYYIAAIPLLAMLAASLAASLREPHLFKTRERLPGHLIARLAVAGVITASAISVPATAWAMTARTLAPEERLHLGYIFDPTPHDPLQAKDQHLYASAVRIAHSLDSMRLPHGAILVDDFTPCVSFIILASAHPQQFVIPTDRDFERALGNPDVFNVRYLMVPPPVELGRLDALSRQYRFLYKNGEGIASQTREFKLRGCPQFRLFRVLRDTT
jgi:hypothetical protein